MAKRELGLEDIAAEVGRLFGTTETHARRWLNQRNALLEVLGTVRDQADRLMHEIRPGGAVQLVTDRIRWWDKKRGRPQKNVMAAPLTDTPRKRKGRRKMSEETKAKMRASAQKRWAEKRKAAGGSKRGSLTPDRTQTTGRTATK